VKVTPVKPLVEAVRVFEPAVVPSVQPPTVATPALFVVCVPPVTEPPPLATAKVTVTPLTGFPFASFTVTAGAVLTADPAVALCPSPAVLTTEAAVPTVPVAVNVTAVKPLVEAVRELDPATVPSVQPPTVATPDAFVVTELPVIAPPPLVTVNVTGTTAITSPR
jgi:hypothetical protein